MNLYFSGMTCSINEVPVTMDFERKLRIRESYNRSQVLAWAYKIYRILFENFLDSPNKYCNLKFSLALGHCKTSCQAQAFRQYDNFHVFSSKSGQQKIKKQRRRKAQKASELIITESWQQISSRRSCLNPAMIISMGSAQRDSKNQKRPGIRPHCFVLTWSIQLK